MEQNPHAVLVIRPVFFGVNPETAADNHFQTAGAASDRAAAIAEFDAMVIALRSAGVDVIVVEQAREDTPDAVFPNNWVSFQPTGEVVLYPMATPSRRREVQPDILSAVTDRFPRKRVIDLTPRADQGDYLEGTGAIVFDHTAKTALMAQSGRADPTILEELCDQLGYHCLIFDAVDAAGRRIYHTNVMMAVGRETAVIGSSTIQDPRARDKVMGVLARDDRTVVDLSLEQIAAFAGNMFEVDGQSGPVLVMSATARAALTPEQVSALTARVTPVVVKIPTIEKSGGSARCMLAGISL